MYFSSSPLCVFTIDGIRGGGNELRAVCAMGGGSLGWGTLWPANGGGGKALRRTTSLLF